MKKLTVYSFLFLSAFHYAQNSNDLNKKIENFSEVSKMQFNEKLIISNNELKIVSTNEDYTFNGLKPEIIIGLKMNDQIEIYKLYFPKTQISEEMIFKALDKPQNVILNISTDEIKEGEFSTLKVSTYEEKEEFNNQKLQEVKAFEWIINDMKITAVEDIETQMYIVLIIQRNN